MKVILLLISLALAAFGPASASGQDTVRIGLSVRNVVLMPFYFAQDKGFFEKEGLKAEIIQIRSNLQVAGVVAGELDFMSGVGTAIDAIRKGLPLKVVAVLYKAPLFSLVTGTSINRLRELEGKRSGSPVSAPKATMRRFGCLRKMAWTSKKLPSFRPEAPPSA